jgi:small subunit ribosomal protein S2
MPLHIPTPEELLKAACHFGHPKEKWNPKMSPYLYGTMKGVHIFDLQKTEDHLRRTCEAMRALLADGKTILFVSTKQQTVPLLEALATKLQQPMVTKRWIPGLLTNWATVKRRLQYYLDLRRSFQTGEVEKYTKKEQLNLRKKLTKLDTALGGVSMMKNLPHALFVVDAVRDRVAVREARGITIPVFGICDSNADPDDFTICIPANDDAVKSVAIILSTLESALTDLPKKPEAKEKESPSSPGYRSVIAAG